jgi:hypothetical protein
MTYNHVKVNITILGIGLLFLWLIIEGLKYWHIP